MSPQRRRFSTTHSYTKAIVRLWSAKLTQATSKRLSMLPLCPHLSPTAVSQIVLVIFSKQIWSFTDVLQSFKR